MNNFIDATAKSKTATKKQYWVLHTENDLGSPKTRVLSDLETAKGFKQLSRGLYVHTVFEEGNRKVMYFCVGKYDRFEEARSVQFSYQAISGASRTKALPKPKRQKHDPLRRFIIPNIDYTDSSIIKPGQDTAEHKEHVSFFNGNIISRQSFRYLQESITFARPGFGSRGGKDPKLNAEIESSKRFASWLASGAIVEVL